MRRDLLIKSGNLAGTSDFRVLAPIKKGFVPSNEAVTYKTRVKRVLRTTHAGRAGGFEYELARVLSDSVERVGVIHSVGIAVLEPEDKVILTVTFDGAWEAYIRIIWQKATRLLDLVFCNCDGYVLGYESTYEEWGIWLKKAQSEAYFLYATPALTVDDTRYLGMHERVYRREAGDAADLRVTRMRIPSAEDIARQSLFGTGGPIGTDPTNAGFGVPMTKQAAGLHPFSHGVRSLVGLYRLADLYPPGTRDGDILHRAAQELLPEFRQMLGDGVYQTGIFRAMRRFEEAVLWMLRSPAAEPFARQDLPLAPPDEPKYDAGNVQGGILSQYPDGIDHGCLLLIAFESPAAVAALLSVLPFTSEAEADKEKLKQSGQIATNIAFTVEGLRAAGLTDDEVRELPEEFVQGMERRAGLLGDLRFNHPRRWRLPPLNWDRGENATDLAEGDEAPRIDFSAVHAVIQVRLVSSSSDAAASKAQLMTALRKLIADSNELMVDGKKVADGKGVKPLSLQWMQRQRNKDRDVIEHFGFLDGTSNPVLRKDQAGRRYSNHVNLGEILCGHPNMADKSGGHAKAPKLIRDLLQDGSFLAVRKLRQDVEALETALSAAVEEAADAGVKLTREDLMAKMMGRWPDDGSAQAGEALATVVRTKPPSNDFHFDGDVDGRMCPFHAHIRRVNPRERNPEPGSRPPRLMRRGMSYGPPRSAGYDKERGLIFMAYNASLGEQYELVQRWLNGGNSSGSYSGQSDPIFGQAEPGRRRHFRFEHQGKTVRMALDRSDRLHDGPRPFVRVEWGAYLLAPSKSALAILKERAEAKYDTRPVAWSAKTGDLKIADLREIEKQQGAQAAITAWKAALEDPDAATDFTTASIWAAIRERHGGVLKTPFAVLIAERGRVDDALLNVSGNLSVKGYLPRMHDSFGEIYLGLDAQDPAYQHDSVACNDAILALDKEVTFEKARESTAKALQALVDEAKSNAREDGETSWNLTLEVRELVDPLLADFCEEWFGLPKDGKFFSRGGYRWDWKQDQPPYYPGHFIAPSRYFFQPRPGEQLEKIGKSHGVALKSAMTKFLRDCDEKQIQITAPVAKAILNSKPGQDRDFAARTLVGAVIGFVPTVNGNILRILNEWLREGNLWALRARLDGTAATGFEDAWKRLRADFVPAMQLRTAPEVVWRTATAAHTVGEWPHEVEVERDEVVVIGVSSATQQSLQQGKLELYQAFGGNRKAASHPTHACPGADPALAVMLGFFSALVESRLRLRVGPGPLTLALDGRLDPPTEEFKKNVRGTISLGMNSDHKFGMDTVAPQKVAVTPLLAIGDSWLFDQWQRDFGVSRPNLIRSLLPLGYKDLASGIKDFAYAGRRLSDMAQRQFLISVQNYIADEPGLKALLLSGGGNDVISGFPGQQPLFKMLQPRGPGAPELNEAEVASFMDGTLANYYKKILDTLTASTSIPILIHGYDHPIPDGRGDHILTVDVGPWIQPIIRQRGYDLVPPELVDLAPVRDVTRRLIDRFNAMIARVAAPYRNVHHVNLTGTLAKAYGSDYKTHWNNEMHPRENGFDLLAKLIEAKLKSLKI